MMQKCAKFACADRLVGPREMIIRQVRNRVLISGSGLKQGRKNHRFWSEIGQGFQEACRTPPPKFPGSTLQVIMRGTFFLSDYER